MAASRDEYLKLVRGLPPPMLGQTVRFARHVANAHSWYKHLPVRRKVPFVFFLDPNAGKVPVHSATGGVTLVENTSERNSLHYTSTTTRGYRGQFGYWNYHSPKGSNLYMYDGRGGWAANRSEGLSVL